MRLHTTSLRTFALALCRPRPRRLQQAGAAQHRLRPYDKAYALKMDLAQVEYKYPIPAAELARITPDYLAKLDQEQLDQIYARLPPAPSPMAPSRAASCCRGASSGKFRLSEIVGGFTGTACTSRAW
jgi:hypothetical protein